MCAWFFTPLSVIYEKANKVNIQQQLFFLDKFIWFQISLLVLSFSNAAVERLFSLMGLVKSKLRTKMNTKLLCSVISIREGLKLDKVCCYNIKIPEDIVNKIGSYEKYQKELVYDEDDAIEILDFINNLV